LCTGGSLGEG
jgi:Protein of unknown function (DUF992)